jgi:hypothetical protein
MKASLVRVLGLVFAVGGVLSLALLAEVSFRPVKPWSDVLVFIGMPLMLLLVLAGWAVLFLGIWMLLRAGRRLTTGR